MRKLELEFYLCPPYSHSLFPWGEERPIWLVSLGNFWNTCALAAQVPQDAVSTPPRGQWAGGLRSHCWSAWDHVELLPVTKPILSSDFLVYFSIGSEYARQRYDFSASFPHGQVEKVQYLEPKASVWMTGCHLEHLLTLRKRGSSKCLMDTRPWLQIYTCFSLFLISFSFLPSCFLCFLAFTLVALLAFSQRHKVWKRFGCFPSWLKE